VPLERWYFPTKLHGIAFHKNVIFCIKTVRIIDMKFYGMSTLSLMILFNYIFFCQYISVVMYTCNSYC
jgi:hypothetical protein